MQRLTQKTTGFAHADWRETRKNDKVSVGYEVDIRRLGVMDKITIAIADDQEMTVEMLSNIVASHYGIDAPLGGAGAFAWIPIFTRGHLYGGDQTGYQASDGKDRLWTDSKKA